MRDFKVQCVDIYAVVNNPAHARPFADQLHAFFDIRGQRYTEIRCELQAGTRALVFSKVSLGLAYNLKCWAQEYPGCSFEFVDVGTHDYYDTEDNNLYPPGVQTAINAAKHAETIAKEQVEKLEYKLKRQQEFEENHREQIDHLRVHNRSLKNQVSRLERALVFKMPDVRIDPDDPDTYIVRPSARTEARLLGGMSDDVITVVWQILKPKPLAALRRKTVGERIRFGDKQYIRQDATGVNGEITKALRRAIKPNTRGSLNASKRVTNMLRNYTASFWEYESHTLTIASNEAGKHLKNSKFNW